MNAVLDGSPRRCNGVVLARLRAAATRAKSHVIHCWTGLLGFLVGLWASSRVSMLDDVVASRFAIIERKFEIVNAKKAWLIVDRVVVYH